MGNKWRVLLIVLVLALGGVLAGCKGTDQSSAEGKATRFKGKAVLDGDFVSPAAAERQGD